MTVVVITGASGGVGRAVARRFAADGAAVGLIARGRAGLEGALADVVAAGGRGRVLPCDVAHAGAVDAAAARAEAALGPIDVWINCAMATVFGEFVDLGTDEFRRVTEVTYLGYVHGTRAALRRMLARDRGVIVQVGSALAYRAIPLQSAYCGAKHAINGFTEAVRCELLHRRSGVRLVQVHLPALNTPQFEWGRSKMPRQAQPVPPIYQPEVAAAAIHHAARHPRRQLLVGWPTVLAVEADKVAAGAADHWLARTGYHGQMLDQPRDPRRPDNLFRAADGERDFGAHGRFDARARASSAQLWLATHRLQALLLLLAAALVAAVLSARAG
ncbi:MAG TPA: SDR family oxidoreductase [Kofleriaceae bacterium]|nr:SDR family oxidoreductase [Kofleriaceae bacterium]